MEINQNACSEGKSGPFRVSFFLQGLVTLSLWKTCVLQPHGFPKSLSLSKDCSDGKDDNLTDPRQRQVRD